MKLSTLAETTGVPIATVKYYLRQGLLPAGRLLSRTQADYDDTHVERIRLIRALTGVGELDMATVQRVLAVVDDPGDDRLELLRAAHESLQAPDPEPRKRGDEQDDTTPSRARVWAGARGWHVDDPDPVLDDLDRAWAACSEAGVHLDEAELDARADVMEQMARIDIESVPEEPTAAVRQVVLGTVLLDPVLVALRRLAQRHQAGKLTESSD